MSKNETNWDAIRNEYLTSNISYRKLADKHKVPYKTLRDRGKREGWVAKRAETRDRIVAKSLENAEKAASDYKSELYELAFKVALDLRAMTESHSLEDLVALGLKPRDITGALKDLGDVLHVKSDADLREQEARIANLKKQADGDAEGREIRVTISSELEEYAK